MHFIRTNKFNKLKYIKLGFDIVVGPGFGSYNLHEAQQSLERMKEFVGMYSQVNVYFGHGLNAMRTSDQLFSRCYV